MSRTIPICDDHASGAPRTGVLGWDVGGANVKVARLGSPTPPPPPWSPLTVAVRAYELQRDPAALPSTLSELATTVGAAPDDVHAVTMTAELSQYFRLKRHGVAFVLDAMATAFPAANIQVYTTHGEFLDAATARNQPLAVAAANWTATARTVAQFVRDAIVIDVGTTTTDIVPVVDGNVVAAGWTDPARLRSGELVYLGTVRTPVEAVVHSVPIAGASAGVSAEGFALIGDVHVWRGTLAPEAYSTPTPDGRPATREFAGERLARVVCGDRELLDEAALDRLADAVADAQITRTAAAIDQVRERHPTLTTAVVAGIGDFIAAAAAERAGLRVRRLADELGDDAARHAPAAAVALLLAAALARSAAVGLRSA